MLKNFHAVQTTTNRNTGIGIEDRGSRIEDRGSRIEDRGGAGWAAVGAAGNHADHPGREAARGPAAGAFVSKITKQNIVLVAIFGQIHRFSCRFP